MSEERRYDEADIRKIFELAGSGAGEHQRAHSPSEGLTLAELQSIAGEVGLSPQQIADAADALAFPPTTLRRNLFGMPIALTRTVRLPRLPDDQEWERLLVELRAAFAVQGKAESQGNLREWTSRNAFAYIEPADNGGRLRLGSSQPTAFFLNAFGVAWIAGGLVTLVTLAVTGDLAGANAFLAPACGAVGVGALGYNRWRLTRWARACEAQMRRVVDRAKELFEQ